jgi:hypothetical protein
MGWVIEIPSEEREAGSLSVETTKRARAALEKNGCVLLRGLFAKAKVEEMLNAYLTQFGAMNAEQMAKQAEAPAPNPSTGWERVGTRSRPAWTVYSGSPGCSRTRC